MRRVYLFVFILLLFTIAPLSAQEEALSTIGTLGASNLYVTYLAIGALADAHSSDVYDDAQVIQLMQEIMNLIRTSGEALNTLQQSGILEGDDLEYVSDMLSAYNLLLNQAHGYKEYAATGEQKYANLYDSSRTSAWEKIVVLLGIEE